MTEDAYLGGHIREALAERGELHVEIAVSADKIVLTGQVASEDRRLEVHDLVQRMAEERDVHNQVDVVAPEGPPRVEELP